MLTRLLLRFMAEIFCRFSILYFVLTLPQANVAFYKILTSFYFNFAIIFHDIYDFDILFDNHDIYDF